MVQLIENVTIVGGGVIGSQIAFQVAFCGFNVKLLIREGDEVEVVPKLERLKKVYLNALDEMKAGTMPICKGIITDDEELTDEKYEECREQVENASVSIQITTDQKEACKKADLIIEAIFESTKAKIELFEQLSELMEEKTILVSNSSTFLPSTFAACTGRPEKFLNFHFANKIYELNTVEIMGHAGTEQRYIDEMINFAKQIKMVPLELLKEQKGYILNTMLVPLLDSALYLWASGVCTPETCDKTWRISTATARGPFEIIDMVGIATVYHIYLLNSKNSTDPLQATIAKKLKAMIDQGKLGICSGEGFYKYNN